MSFDILSAIEVTASAAIVAAVLSFSLSQSVAGRLRAALIVAGWFLVVVLLGATDALGPQNAGMPGLAVLAALPVAVLCYAFLALPAARAALLATPLWALIALNVLRSLGVSFVLLYAARRLPAPFAPSAGWGDIFIGVTAGPLAWIAWRDGARANNLILAWNVLGVLDLVFALGFGATSSPGPIQLFVGPPSTQIMTSLPWLLIPGFLVPIFLSLHIAIFDRLRRDARVARPQDRMEAPNPLHSARI